MAAHHPESPVGANAQRGGGISFDDGGQSDPVDLWTLPRQVAATPPATDTLLAAWAGVQQQDGLPSRHREQPPDVSAISDPAASPRHRARAALPSLVRTLLVSAIVSAVVGLGALPIIGLLVAGPDGRSTGSARTDDRVVISDPAGGCLTMLVKPRKAGTTTNVNGTCFSVG